MATKWTAMDMSTAEIFEHMAKRLNRLPISDRVSLFRLLGGDLDPIVSELIRRETNDRGETLKQVGDRIYAAK
jgi:hypothetical protein